MGLCGKDQGMVAVVVYLVNIAPVLDKEFHDFKMTGSCGTDQGMVAVVVYLVNIASLPGKVFHDL
jgi:hypothetical protein